MERSTAERVRNAYRHTRPWKRNDHGVNEWFRRELANRDIEVSKETVSRWMRDRVPVDRLVEVDEVVQQLEAEARTRLQDALAELGP